MPISRNIATAIKQLRPEIPTALGSDSDQFLAQLEAALAQGNEKQVRALFDKEKYPVLYDRLLQLLSQQGGKQGTTKSGVILPGNVILEFGESKDFAHISASVKQGTLFYCPVSEQLVELSQEVIAHPIAEEEYTCATHQQPLRKILSDNIERREETGYMSLFYCNVGSHLLLLFPEDLLMNENEEGDILCPEHRKPMQRLQSGLE